MPRNRVGSAARVAPEPVNKDRDHPPANLAMESPLSHRARVEAHDLLHARPTAVADRLMSGDVKRVSHDRGDKMHDRELPHLHNIVLRREDRAAEAPREGNGQRCILPLF